MDATQLEDPLANHAKYRTLRELGRGGMGAVYLAEHRMLKTQVVVKLLHSKLSERADLVDRLRLEAQTLARLEHPNLVRVSDFGKTDGGQPYFVMEYLPGRSLREAVVARGGFLPVAEVIQLALQTLQGLQFAHEAGLVHRDLKLDNLFLCDPTEQQPEGLVKILDFGVAKVLDDADDAPAPLAVPTATGMVVGTPRFFAPEQARGKKLDARADIYSFGMVLYSLLAGRGPFDDAMTITEMAKAHVLRQAAPPSTFARQAIPAALDAVVLRCIEKQPQQRFQTAAELSQELNALASVLTHAPAHEAWAQTEAISLPAHTPATQPPALDSGALPTAPQPARGVHAAAATVAFPSTTKAPGAVLPTEVLATPSPGAPLAMAPPPAQGGSMAGAASAAQHAIQAALPSQQAEANWGDPTLVPQATAVTPSRLLWVVVGLSTLLLVLAVLIFALG